MIMEIFFIFITVNMISDEYFTTTVSQYIDNTCYVALNVWISINKQHDSFHNAY